MEIDVYYFKTAINDINHNNEIFEGFYIPKSRIVLRRTNGITSTLYKRFFSLENDFSIVEMIEEFVLNKGKKKPYEGIGKLKLKESVINDLIENTKLKDELENGVKSKIEEIMISYGVRI